jgi:hypothetical protein
MTWKVLRQRICKCRKTCREWRKKLSKLKNSTQLSTQSWWKLYRELEREWKTWKHKIQNWLSYWPHKMKSTPHCKDLINKFFNVIPHNLKCYKLTLWQNKRVSSILAIWVTILHRHKESSNLGLSTNQDNFNKGFSAKRVVKTTAR